MRGSQLPLWAPPAPVAQTAPAPESAAMQQLRAELTEARHDVRWWRAEGKRLAEAAMRHLEHPTEHTADVLRACAIGMRGQRERHEHDERDDDE